jgi:hypothetical protein
LTQLPLCIFQIYAQSQPTYELKVFFPFLFLFFFFIVITGEEINKERRGEAPASPSPSAAADSFSIFHTGEQTAYGFMYL